MPERDPSSMIQVGLDILNTTRDEVTKTLLGFLGDVIGAARGGAAAVDGDKAEWWQHVGFLSRPSKPEAGKQSAQAMAFRRSDRDVIFASRDLRGQDLAGDLGYGETFLYAPGEDGRGQAKIKLCKDGSIVIYTKKGNVSSGVGMVVQLDAVNDAIRITNAKGYGLIIDTDGVKILAGSSGAKFSPSGSTIASGSTLGLDGTTITLGNALLPGLNSALKGPSGMMGAPSPKVLIE